MDNRNISQNLIEAWKRYLNNSYTSRDFMFIRDSVKDGDGLQEFDEVFNRKWDMAMNDLYPTPEEKEIYRKEFAQFFAEHQRNSKIQRFKDSKIIGGRFRKIFYYAAAAVLLLGLLIPAVYLYVKPKTEQTAVQYVEKTTQRGEIRTVVLPDRTEVTLNAESRLTYPAVFTNERSVELHGEALFDVTSDPARPFTVKTEKMNVKVVGTVFDVKDYNEDGLSSVSVASGKVEVALAGEKLLLEQNQQVTMYKATGNFEKMTIDAGNYLSWTEGTLYFYRTPIREVINILNRLYPQVDIELAEGEYSNLITGKHDNITSDNIIKGIAYAAGLKCKKAGNKYTLYNE